MQTQGDLFSDFKVTYLRETAPLVIPVSAP